LNFPFYSTCSMKKIMNDNLEKKYEIGMLKTDKRNELN